ncbi:g2658 [Coccomyxa viridis]|uniref:G2658 protein n=1 Tax=Coccomyxa viridis TaxID=1274662 RepID=A0ABP1FMK9_9CHLO
MLPFIQKTPTQRELPLGPVPVPVAGQVAEPLTPMVAEPLTFPQRMMQAIRPPQQQQQGQRGGPPPTSRAGKLVPGRPLPHIVLSTVQGGKIELGAPTGRWQMIVVYRGKHCPVSKNYLASLQQIYYELDELGVEVIAVSGDGRERAESFLEALKATTDTKEVSFKIAYGLPISEMLRWGLYISEPRNIRETDQPFPEPALFLLNPDGEVVVIDYSNSPFARPDLRILVEGIRYIQENDYPVRGTWGLA